MVNEHITVPLSVVLPAFAQQWLEAEQSYSVHKQRAQMQFDMSRQANMQSWHIVPTVAHCFSVLAAFPTVENIPSR